MTNNTAPDPNPAPAAADHAHPLKHPHGLETEPLPSGALHFPEVEPWPEPVNGELLLNDLRQTLLRFVVLPKWAPEALAR